jgi:hypothetical protein
MRVGCFSMVVSPYACLIVTGNWVLLPEPVASDTDVAGPVLQAESVRVAAANTAAAFPAEEKRVRRLATGPGKRGCVTGLLG